VLIECVINISEGRDQFLLAELDLAAGPTLVDRHSDWDHHRSVFTLAGPADAVDQAARDLATAAVGCLNLSHHAGVHPRLGVLDVVPFVPYRWGALPPKDLVAVEGRRDAFAAWLGAEMGVPAFRYGRLADGTERTLPEVRRGAFTSLDPDDGPAHPHPTAGATAVGARKVLVAYNVWVSDVAVAKRVAPLVRGPALRTLGLAVGSRAQVSCNLIEPALVGPAECYDAVAEQVTSAGGSVMGAELVGLIPSAILGRVAPSRWGELGLAETATVEARLEAIERQ
jgi:glutamate formiminotransferase